MQHEVWFVSRESDLSGPSREVNNAIHWISHFPVDKF